MLPLHFSLSLFHIHLFPPWSEEPFDGSIGSLSLWFDLMSRPDSIDMCTRGIFHIDAIGGSTFQLLIMLITIELIDFQVGKQLLHSLNILFFDIECLIDSIPIVAFVIQTDHHLRTFTYICYQLTIALTQTSMTVTGVTAID
jgi:hypothetical protein